MRNIPQAPDSDLVAMWVTNSGRHALLITRRFPFFDFGPVTEPSAVDYFKSMTGLATGQKCAWKFRSSRNRSMGIRCIKDDHVCFRWDCMNEGRGCRGDDVGRIIEREHLEEIARLRAEVRQCAAELTVAAEVLRTILPASAGMFAEAATRATAAANFNRLSYEAPDDNAPLGR